MGDYKGIFYGTEKEKRYFEGGAHFKYTDLCKVLALIKEKREKENNEKKSEIHIENSLLSSNKKKSRPNKSLIGFQKEEENKAYQKLVVPPREKSTEVYSRNKKPTKIRGYSKSNVGFLNYNLNNSNINQTHSRNAKKGFNVINDERDNTFNYNNNDLLKDKYSFITGSYFGESKIKKNSKKFSLCKYPSVIPKSNGKRNIRLRFGSNNIRNANITSGVSIISNQNIVQMPLLPSKSRNMAQQSQSTGRANSINLMQNPSRTFMKNPNKKNLSTFSLKLIKK